MNKQTHKRLQTSSEFIKMRIELISFSLEISEKQNRNL